MAAEAPYLEVSAATRLDSAELEYHKQMVAETSAAQRQFEQANVALVKAQGAVEAWSRFLQSRYGLLEGDTVDEQGVFVRKDRP